MSAYIIAQDVAYVTADGRTVFQNLNLNMTRGVVGLVGRNGVGKSTLLRMIAAQVAPSRGTLSVAGSLAMLAQNPDPSGTQSLADMFNIAQPWQCLHRIEQGIASDRDMECADWLLPQRFSQALQKSGLPDLPADTQLSALSGGQRTRAALSALVFQQPDIVLLDEPSNNLDGEGREILRNFLQQWRGLALVVSHDRDLLRHVEMIGELSSNGLRLYGGNWDFFQDIRQRERQEAERQLTSAEQAVRQAQMRAQELAERQARKDAVGRQGRANAGLPKILLGSRAQNAENSAGMGRRLAERKNAELQARLQLAQTAVEREQSMRFTVTAERPPAGRIVLAAEAITGGPLADHPVIQDFSLQVAAGERIAIAGGNGRGKTSLLRLLSGELVPGSGKVRRTGNAATFDQDLRLLDPDQTLFENFRRLNVGADDNAAYAALARFAFRNSDALRKPAQLSGGERLRAALACVLGGTRNPELLLLDEPTNHLDLHSIEQLELALQDYDGALIVISHDEEFLRRIGIEKRVAL